MLALHKFDDEVEHEAIITLEEEIGLVRTGVRILPGEPIHAAFDVPKIAEELGVPGQRDDIAAAVGLTSGEIGFDNHRPCIFSAGVSYVFVPVRDLAPLSRAWPVDMLWRRGYLADTGAAYLYRRETRDPASSFAARMFSPGLGMVEDPSTGSAAAAFAGVVTRFEALGGKRHVFTLGKVRTWGGPVPSILKSSFQRAGWRVCVSAEIA